jgi:hypothetical protein
MSAAHSTQTAVRDALWSTRSLPDTAVDEVEIGEGINSRKKQSQNRGKGVTYLKLCMRDPHAKYVITRK